MIKKKKKRKLSDKVLAKRILADPKLQPLIKENRPELVMLHLTEEETTFLKFVHKYNTKAAMNCIEITSKLMKKLRTTDINDVFKFLE
jgi:hypothetical protein